jgi:hypothetical protein
MPSITVNPVNQITVRVNQTTDPVVATSTQFIGAGNSYIVAAEALAVAQDAYEAANVAYAYANTKVSKDGDSMTDSLYFVTAISNTVNMVGVGNIQDANGIDLWANTGTLWAQLNYANTNFAFVDAAGAYLQTSSGSQVNAFLDGTLNLISDNNKAFSVLVEGGTQALTVAANTNLYATGTYFGVVDKVDGGIFS